MNRMSFLLIFCLFAIGCDRLSILSPGELRIENRSDARIESVKVSVNGVVKAEVSGEATSGVIWSPDYPFPGRGSRYRIEIQLSGSANCPDCPLCCGASSYNLWSHPFPSVRPACGALARRNNPTPRLHRNPFLG